MSAKHFGTRRRYVAGAVVLGLLLVGNDARPVGAHDLIAAEIAPLLTGIELHRAYLTEIERQGQNRVQQLSAWIGWWTSIKALATDKADKLMKNLDERIQNAEKAGAVLGGLLNSSPPNQRHIPHLGWHDTVTIATYANNVRTELAKIRNLAAQGTAEWHIAAAGWVTGQGIQKIIDDLLKQQRDINQGMRDGTYEVHIAGPGWTRGANHRNAVTELEKQQRAIQDRVAAGDYEVHIPGLGPRTRKTLDAEIAGAEAELERRRAILARGELTIHRPPTGWKNINELRDSLAADATSFNVMQKTVSDGLYTIWIADAGWVTGVDLEGRVKSYEETLAKTQDAIARGEYRAQVPVGWSTRKEIEDALQSLNQQLARPEVDAKTREYLVKQIEAHRKSLAELQAISAYDIAIQQLEKAKASRWLTEVMKLARPDFERRQVERAEREHTLAEYPIEGALWLKPLELQLARLRTARQMIPGG